MSVAKEIEFKDRAINLGAQLVRSVASKTNDVAGDGWYQTTSEAPFEWFHNPCLCMWHALLAMMPSRNWVLSLAW